MLSTSQFGTVERNLLQQVYTQLQGEAVFQKHQFINRHMPKRQENVMTSFNLKLLPPVTESFFPSLQGRMAIDTGN